jgi:hypothetical protein
MDENGHKFPLFPYHFISRAEDPEKGEPSASSSLIKFLLDLHNFRVLPSADFQYSPPAARLNKSKSQKEDCEKKVRLLGERANLHANENWFR